MIQLPALDDKRFRQIFDEAVARIPTLTEQWNDFNPQDTGIMLLELLSAMTELQNFYLDRVGDRFYEKYLELVTDAVCGEKAEQRVQRFARELVQSEVAVTTEDYERLALRSPFSISQAKANVDRGFVRLTIFRPSRPLDSGELEQLRRWLEPYRLLTARIKIEQAIHLSVDIVCRVVMNGTLGREAACRDKLEAIFRRVMSEQRLGETPCLESIRLELLSIREIVQVDELSIRRDGSLPTDAEQGRAFMQVHGLNIMITGQRG